MVLVSTSNRAPDGLYQGGLQRALFLPFIALLKERCEVHDIRGARDYRLLAKKLLEPMYFTGKAASEELQHCMEVLSGGAQPAPVEISVAMGRSLRVPKATQHVAFLPYKEALEASVSAADYISLCTRFHTVCVDGLPCFTAATKAAAYRLVTLVDVAYERHVRLVLAAQGEPQDLFRRVLTHDEYEARQASLTAADEDELVVCARPYSARTHLTSPAGGRYTRVREAPHVQPHRGDVQPDFRARARAASLPRAPLLAPAS